MKTFLLFLLLISFSKLFSQRENEIRSLKNKLTGNRTSIYLFCRGTTSKSALIAHKFNFSDTNITHVGIGFYQHQKFIIYNVSDITKNDTSALQIDTLESFLNSPDVYYFSLWEYRATKAEVAILMQNCKLYETKRIIFDASFRLENKDTLYCSEFCVNNLKLVNNDKFSYKPHNYVLNNSFYEGILKRKTLLYYPVDFFQKNKFFKRVFEISF